MGSCSGNGCFCFRETNFIPMVLLHLLLSTAITTALSWRYLPSQSPLVYEALACFLGLAYRIPLMGPLGLWDHRVTLSYHANCSWAGIQIGLYDLGPEHEREQGTKPVHQEAWVYIPAQPLGCVAITKPLFKCHFLRKNPTVSQDGLGQNIGFTPW